MTWQGLLRYKEEGNAVPRNDVKLFYIFFEKSAPYNIKRHYANITSLCKHYVILKTIKHFLEYLSESLREKIVFVQIYKFRKIKTCCKEIKSIASVNACYHRNLWLFSKLTPLRSVPPYFHPLSTAISAT